MHVDVGWGWVRLRQATVTLEGVAGAHAIIERATVDLDGFTPTRVEARGLDVKMMGSAADFVIDLGRWAREHPDAVTFPVVADGVRLAWYEAPSEPPWLEVQKSLIAPSAGGSRLTADRAMVLGVSVGPVGATWSSDGAAVTFGFGDPDPNAALLRMDVVRATGTAKLRLSRVPLSAIERPLGVRLPVDPTTMVEGTAELSLTPGADTLDVEGTLHGELIGYVPPHPKELNGIVFGKVTTLDTKVKLSADRRKVHLTETRVKAGAFALGGSGTIERRTDHAWITMDMAGDIPCSSLAKSATVANIGGPLGQFLGDTVKNALAGSVRVGVKVEADSRELAQAKLTQSVSIGCRLKL